MAAHRIDIRDALRDSENIIALSRRQSDKKWGRADIPEAVEVRPTSSPSTALLLVPLFGLILGIHVWRQFQRTRRKW